jgi:hypothetical protein
MAAKMNQARNIPIGMRELSGQTAGSELRQINEFARAVSLRLG